MNTAANIARAAALLESAQRPLLLLGPEARHSLPLWLALAERLGAAVLTTPDALGLVDGARSAGTFSFGASDAACAAAKTCDVLLAATNLGEFTNRLGQAFGQALVIHASESAADIGRNTAPAIALLAELETTARELLQQLAERLEGTRSPWFDTASYPLESPAPARAGVIDPRAAVDALQAVLPDPVRLCLDITSGSLHVSQRFKPRGAQRVFSSIERSACMGEALMASLGIRLASGVPTLALVGDWCYLMSPAELHFAVEQQLGQYVVLVWANGGGALVGAGVQQQKIDVSARAFRWEKPPRFATLARALNADAQRVTTAKALAAAVKRGLRGDRPALIEASIDPTAVVPAGDRFLSLSEEHH